VIVVEASFDGMAVSQAGYPNVVACLGGHFSQSHRDQINKHFNTVVIATDFDDKERHKYAGCRQCVGNCIGHNPGRALGESIAEQLPNKKIRWASYDYKIIYPDGAKDPNSMTDAQIRQFIKNSVSNFEYHGWNIER